MNPARAMRVCAAIAVGLMLLAVSPRGALGQQRRAEPFKPWHEQNPKFLIAGEVGFPMGDSSYLFPSDDRTVRYWPANGRVKEAPLGRQLPLKCAPQMVAEGLLCVGGLHEESTGQEIGLNTVVLHRPDGSVLSGELSVPRFNAQTVKLGDGSVLVVGGTLRWAYRTTGLDKDNARTTAVEIVRVNGGRIEVIRVADLPGPPRRGFQLVVLNDGKVLATGGTEAWYDACMGCLADSFLFDPATKRWQVTGSMKAARASFTATLMPDGRALAVGGWTSHSNSDADDSVEVFDPRNGAWQTYPKLPAPVANHRAVWLAGANGPTLLIGGGTNAQLQALDPIAQRWSTAGEMRGYRVGAQLLPYRDANGAPWATLFGGVHEPRGQNRQPDYDVERIGLRMQGDRSAGAGGMQLQRTNTALAISTDGRALIAGGVTAADPGWVSTASVDALDRDQSGPVALPALSQDRSGAQAFWLPGGRAVVLGGEIARYNPPKPVGLPAEHYDPKSRSWRSVTITGIDTVMRHAAGTVYGQFVDGDLLAVNQNSATRLYLDGATVRVEPFADLGLSHSGEFIVRTLADGRIIVAGGQLSAHMIAIAGEPGKYRGFGDQRPARRYEIYDPTTRAWRQSAPAGFGATQAAALDDGRVVQLGVVRAGSFQGEKQIDEVLGLTISSPDGRKWRMLPLPDRLASYRDSARLISQGGQLFLTGPLAGNTSGDQMLWWFDAPRKAWIKLADWNTAGHNAKLVIAQTPNGQRVVVAP